MTHSPLHQRLHLRLAIRQNVPPTTLSPLPPYPSSSPPKESPEPAIPSPPSPEPDITAAPLPSPGTCLGVFLDISELLEAAQHSNSMRATHIRPRTAPASPERPGTAYSTRSTIRQVDPSPDNPGDALAIDFTNGGPSAAATSFEPFPPFNPSKTDKTPDEEPNTHIPSTEPAAAAEALRRGGTPHKSRSCSPQKSRSQSPRKHLISTPTLSVHQESPTSTYSAVGSDIWETPDTPSPIPREQQREAYAPLQIRRPFADSKSEGEPVVGSGTHARITDYMWKRKDQKHGGKAKSMDIDREKLQISEPAKSVVPTGTHIVQAMAQPNALSQDQNEGSTLTPFSAAQMQAKRGRVKKEPTRQTSVSRRSEASGGSVASKHSIFSTPGRDEMERKKPIVEEDEGPFAKVTSVQDLEQSRRRVSEGTKEGGEVERKRRFCGMQCAVM